MLRVRGVQDERELGFAIHRSHSRKEIANVGANSKIADAADVDRDFQGWITESSQAWAASSFQG